MRLARRRTLLVSGASGFLGSRFVEGAARAGHSVTALSRRPRPAELPETIAHVQADLELPDSLHGLQPWRWDAVVHLAGAAAKGVPHWTDGVSLLTSHLRCTLNLMGRIPPGWTGRFVLASGFIVYGLPRTLPVGEDHPRNPLHLYALAKLVTEDVVLAAPGLRDRWVLRLPGLFSETRNTGALYHFAVAASTGSVATIAAPVPTPWDVLHVDDAVAALLGSLDSAAVDPGAVNVGYGRVISLDSIAETLFTMCGRTPQVKVADGERHPPFQLDVRRMHEFMGGLPATLDERLRLLLSVVSDTGVSPPHAQA